MVARSLWAWLVLLGCGRVGFDWRPAGGGCPMPVATTVDAVYSTYGANWNDYVAITRPCDRTWNAYDQPVPESACTGAADGYYACIHGGEKRRVEVPGFTSCEGLTLTERLDAFDWFCDDSSGAAAFYTVALKPGKGLRDLINATGDGFEPNSVTITRDGCTVATTTAGSWWSNSFDNTTLAANSSASDPAVKLASPGRIYTATASATTSGYNIDADKVSVVTLGTATLRYSGRNQNECGYADGELRGGQGMNVPICAGAQKFVWVEARLQLNPVAGTTARTGILFVGLTFSRIHGSSVASALEDAAALVGGSKSNLVMDSSFSVSLNGLSVFQAPFNTLVRIKAMGNGNDGIGVSDVSDHTVIQQAFVANNTYAGLHLLSDSSGGTGTLDLANITITQVLGLGPVTLSVERGGAPASSIMSDVTILGMTAARDDGGNGIGALSSYGQGGQAMRVQATNLLFVNGRGIGLWDVTDWNLNDVTLGTATFNLFSSTNVSIGGYLRTHDRTSDCDTQNGNTNIEIDNSCAFGPTLAPPSQNGLDVTGSFFNLHGMVTSDDQVNTSDTSGAALFSTDPASFDWSGFETFYRGWSIGPNTLTDPAAFGKDLCRTGDTCHIYDLRLRGADTLLRNYHGTFRPGQACPPDVDGANAANLLTDSQGNTYLKHAFELVGDGFGDDDGLCESNETCVYAPNSGAYQGEGSPWTVQPCAFHDGTITGVQLRAYPINGT